MTSAQNRPVQSPVAPKPGTDEGPKAYIIFEFKVGSGTDKERNKRAQVCHGLVQRETGTQQRQDWHRGIDAPAVGTDVVEWLNKTVLSTTKQLRVRRTALDTPPRYCVVWDGPHEIRVCYYDLELCLKDGKRFEADYGGLILPIFIRLGLDMQYAIEPLTLTLQPV